MNKLLSALLLLTASCDTGNLTVLADTPGILKEVSGMEIISNSELIWMLNDSGNSPNIYGVNTKGKIIKTLIIDAKNRDWEDLTSDAQGNLYIGDFGNNSKRRKQFSILKINPLQQASEGSIVPENIHFKLPNGVKSKDFEAFFLLKNHFYVFSKESKKFIILKIPNSIGTHVAEIVSEYNFKQKRSQITAADVSADGKTIILLNHDKLWKLSNFTTDNFLSGDIAAIFFEHSSQKEGICFKDEGKVYITDERTKNDGGNLYELSLN